jgi:hypothetical protein
MLWLLLFIHLKNKKMAKKKQRRSRRRRVGAMSLNPGSPLVKVASLAAGYFLGDTINTQVDKVLPASMTAATATGVTAYVPSILELGVGGALLLMKGKPSIIKTVAGGVIAGAGLRRALKKAGVVTGFNMVPVIAGFNRVPVINGVPAQLSGTPAQLAGYLTAANRGGGLSGFRTSRVMGKVGSLQDQYGGSGITNSGSGLME